jgi:acyl-CoA reductase-like NAD-dependent aldehyde dehydrogenase
VYDLINPATGAVFGSVEMTTAEGVDDAVARARQAFPAWRDVAPADRARLLRRFAELVDAHAEELARTEVENAGHTISNARWEAGNVPPTVLTGIAPDAPIQCEEVFGPVVTVTPFGTEDEAVAAADGTEYGLSGSVWTRDLSRALRVSRAVQSGNLSVNSNSSVRYSTPFGGFKQSGLGRELGPDALAAFTETKNIYIAL